MDTDKKKWISSYASIKFSCKQFGIYTLLLLLTGCFELQDTNNYDNISRKVIDDIASGDTKKKLRGLIDLNLLPNDDYKKIITDNNLFKALKSNLNSENAHVRLLSVSELSEIGTMNEELSNILRSEFNTQNTGAKIMVIQIIGNNKFILNKNIDILIESIKNDYEGIALKSISALKKLGEIDDISLIDVLLYRMSVLNKKPFTKSSIIEVLSLVSNEKSKYVYEKLSKIRVDEGSDMNNKIVLDELKDTLKILNKKMSKK